MSHPFSPTQIRFNGYGIDDRRAVSARFWIGGPGSPSVIIPVADLNTGSPELWRRFGELGILLSAADKKAVLQKIQPFSGDSLRFKVVNSPGWSVGYVTPTKVYGAPPCIVERDFGDLDLRKYRSAETLRDWQDNVLPLCAGNSRLMFAIMCAFAGPLLEILGIGSFGFQLFGPSSIGKTIILMVAGSVWGCRVGAGSPLGFLATWATTPEGVERSGRIHNHGFLPVDETRLAGTDREMGKLVATFIMRLAEGVGKNRLVPIGDGGDWQLVYLGSSNLSLAEIFVRAGLEFDDAYRVRFPDITADAGLGYGAFETIHGFADAGEFAKELHRRACTYFGVASEHYLEHLAKDRLHRRNWLVQWVGGALAYYRRQVPVGSPADARITDSFAVVYAAGLLAHRYGILPWTPEEIAWAVQSCERAHHQAVAENQAKLDPIAAVRAYITANLSRFRPVPDPSITDREFSNSLGFLYVNDNDSLEYAVPNKSFARAVAPLNVGDVLRALDTAGLLVRGRDRYVSKVPIRNSTDDGRKFVYRICSSILDVPTN